MEKYLYDIYMVVSKLLPNFLKYQKISRMKNAMLFEIQKNIFFHDIICGPLRTHVKLLMASYTSSFCVY